MASLLLLPRLKTLSLSPQAIDLIVSQITDSALDLAAANSYVVQQMIVQRQQLGGCFSLRAPAPELGNARAYPGQK
jgi:hypothetical protein